MDPVVKLRWIAALRSGDYGQTRGKLHKEDGYCCLGVLCDIVKEEVDGTWIKRSDFAFCFVAQNVTGEGMPPVAVRQFADIGNGACDMLATMNDDGKSFSEIADRIEKEL